ncbi:MAG TPA: hypothetical protein VLW17_12080, partial [Thermoanaerobaculaceae bacterium]|nr:hypothetical protein [Thermoanaerobaculaceae bacterium]
TAPARVPMGTYRLRDGSASFLLPTGWRVQEFGKGTFLAGDQAAGVGFMVGTVDVASPRLNLHYPGVVVSPYLPPDRAWAFVTSHFGLATDLRFVSVSPRRELAAAMAAVHTAGPVEVEDLVYTYTSREGRASKGYTLGFSFGSRLDIGWSFRHLSVAAPAERFDALVPSFTAMLESYRINEGWAAQYIAQGVQHLRQLQQQTSAIVTRNAQEIHQMMQDAYDERQRSHDYIDYQFTNFIRGQQDWVSSVEGGTVYHSDSWGTKNTITGESWQGQPFNYVDFEGANPKYQEQMQAIDSRALFEKYIR